MKTGWGHRADRAGSRTPQAPRSGARGNRFYRAPMMTGARERAHYARQNWGHRHPLAGPIGTVRWEA